MKKILLYKLTISFIGYGSSEVASGQIMSKIYVFFFFLMMSVPKSCPMNFEQKFKNIDMYRKLNFLLKPTI